MDENVEDDVDGEVAVMRVFFDVDVSVLTTDIYNSASDVCVELVRVAEGFGCWV